MSHATFEIRRISDTFIVLIDRDNGSRSVTNDAPWVIDQIQAVVPGGIGKRRVYYRDSSGRYDEMVLNDKGRFKRFAPCTEDQQVFFKTV